ncbi:DUF2254 domain-containing protein [Alkalisalibacterium limincola]|uniref:DUF2254 domain-containing protein n=1 Tax=Alkalisalibacterium limincola TaxID=2699169 RepID=A0A5C8KH90_9GAMM|nr:DUF2254 domain-containing protein [Alkalisalibacterium limincola]TXK59158.1 DUF2254 domain-containing protein [Alkalisalibacterium limincola]
MTLKPRVFLEFLRTSLWVVPMGLVLGMMMLGQFLLWVDGRAEIDVKMMEGAGIDGARGMFQAVAGGMLTLAGVVFSMTLVVLSQATAQYSPRVLRNFLGDRVNQTVLGVFLGIFVYCLVVLRGLGEDGSTLPVLTVLVGLAMSLLGVVFLVYFIHHIARSLQVENIVASIHDETAPVIDRLYPEAQAEGDEAAREDVPAFGAGDPVILARSSGYIQDVDVARLERLACRLDTVIELPHRVGGFVSEGMALVRIKGPVEPDEDAASDVHSSFTLGRQRTIQQDPSFGLRQLVDVAMKALSPGVNDTTTAVLVVDRLSALVRRLCQRRMPARLREVDGVLRLVVARPDFEDYLGLAFDQIRQWGANNPAVLGRMLEVIAQLLPITHCSSRRELLHEHARRIITAGGHAINEECDLAWLRQCYQRVPPV